MMSFENPETTQPDSVRRRHLCVGAWQRRSVANGPGERFVLWLQGCPFRCAGCINPQFWSSAGGNWLPVSDVAAKILGTPGVEGVTYSGGEPLAQARGLALLSRRLQRAGLSVFCYTGYTLEQARRLDDPWVSRLLARVDVLVDGPYVREHAANLPWRGSANQRVHFLSPRYRDSSTTLDQVGTDIELTVGDGRLAMTGHWPAGLWERLQEILKQ
jgi:anaerobic ribonucleoside-triphosphate reductase activating protein